MSSIEYCPAADCNAQVNWAADRCPVCGHDLGAPNQRLANHPDEIAALTRRYQAARDAAEQRGVGPELAAFEQSLTDQAQAAIHCTAKFLHGFITDHNQLYSNYRLQTASDTRKVAELGNDCRRCGSEGTLFGSMAPHIAYAALTLCQRGLVSYGSCAMIVKDITLKSKATVLEENSYDFVRRHRLLPGDPPPAGYRALWQNRQLLAVAKLAGQLQPGSQDFAEIVLYGNGDRSKDQFIEVHIYGSFDHQAIAALTLPRKKPQDPVECVSLEASSDHARQLNIACQYYD